MVSRAKKQRITKADIEECIRKAIKLTLISVLDEVEMSADEIDGVYQRLTRYTKYISNKDISLKDLDQALDKKMGRIGEKK